MSESKSAGLLETIAVALADAAGGSGQWLTATEQERAAVRAEAAHLVTTFGRHGLFVVTAAGLAKIADLVALADAVVEHGRRHGPVSDEGGDA